MKCLKTIAIFCIYVILFAGCLAQAEEQSLFATIESKEGFAKEVSSIIEKAWKEWQDTVVINGVDVEGSRGVLLSGDIGGPILTSPSIMKYFNRKGKSQAEISCFRAVADALENGMRLWQRGYTQMNIPFPQGASCTYTMPPSNNVPVIVASGRSSGERAMSEGSLYNFMLYRSPKDNKDALKVLRASAKGIAVCFDKWKDSCSIVGIVASGGIAPQPAPMGIGPGPVRGARGQGGKLIGPYFNGKLMYDTMVRYYRS